jgi:dTMP kinase
MTLLLDVPVEVGMARSKRRDAGQIRDRFEQERVEFFQRVRAVYLDRARADPARIAVIDAVLDVDEVAHRIAHVLEAKAWIT